MYTEARTSSIVLIGVLISFIVLVISVGAYVLYKLLLQDKLQAKAKSEKKQR